MKFLNKILLAAPALLACSIANPALAADGVVSTNSLPVSAVYDSKEIAMQQLPGGKSNMGFEADPAFFQGANLCISGQGDNWSLRRDGTVDEYNPGRKPSCALIDADGHARVANPFGDKAVPWIGVDTNGDGTVDRIIAWAGRDRLNGVLPY